nr:carboxylesterase family protein [Streptomyces leeuwenhoekii]
MGHPVLGAQEREGLRGDPGNVTVAGVSFGASAIAAHLTSPASKGLFHRGVMASGEAMTDMPARAMGSDMPGYPTTPSRDTSRCTRTSSPTATRPCSCRCRARSTSAPSTRATSRTSSRTRRPSRCSPRRSAACRAR